MHMYKTVGQEIRDNAVHDSRLFALDQARKEGKQDALVLVSVHLDRFATHVANEGLSAIEIVELLRQEAEKLGRGKTFNGVV